MIEIDDYTRALETFAAAASRLGDRVCSIILYGSMVKGTVRPGVSDILDAAVVLRGSVLTSEAEYDEVLDVLTEACAPLQDTGILFHPVHYFVLDDDGWTAPAHFLPAWSSERYSQIVAGEDVRPLLRTSDADCEFMRGRYVQLYWAILQTALTMKMTSRPADGARVRATHLLRMLRDVPQFACLAGGAMVDRDDAIAAMPKLLPDVDIDRLSRLCDPSAAAIHGLGERELVDEILAVNDDVYRAVSQRMRESEA